MAEVISSTRNPAVAEAAKLHRARHRRETGRTLIEGPSVVSEAIAAGVDVIEIYALEGEAVSGDRDVRYVTEAVLGKLAGTSTPRGPIAVIGIPAPTIDTTRPVLVAWGVNDPGNVGTLIRSAAAFGYGFVAGPETADPWSPKVVRSGAGGHFHTTIGAVDGVGGLSAFDLVGTVAVGGSPPGPIGVGEAVLVGSEAHGLPDDLVAACSRLVTIPMATGTESLNAAVAGSIVAYLGTLPPPH